MNTLRPYQEEAHAAVFDALMDDYKRILYTAATGTGKTVTFAALILSFLKEYHYKVLVLANRKELIKQAYVEIRDTCELDEYTIDVEMGDNRFNHGALVVVGSVQTCYRETRLRDWVPDVIICDEAHYCAAQSWQTVFKRFPDAVLVGCTATALRGDKQQLYALRADGTQVMVEDRKTRKERPVELSETVFDKLVAEYDVLSAIEDGYLVQIEKYVVRSNIDLSAVHVRRGKDGDVDFVASELTDALEQDDEAIIDRITIAINGWKQKGWDNRPTIVFAPSVRYAQWAAQLWHEAGYTAQAIDAETDSRAYDPAFPWIPAGAGARECALENVRLGKVQVTVNVGIYTHGTDVDVWSCVVMLKPTTSWALYCQCAGRGTRPLRAVAKQISQIESADERREAISNSAKPDVAILDVIDKNSRNNPCSAPAILGLPCDFDFQGAKMTEVKKLLDEFDDVQQLALFACPKTLKELTVSLERIRLTEGAKSRDKWLLRPDGNYTFGKAPVGYKSELLSIDKGDGVERWQLRCMNTQTGEVFVDRTAIRTEADTNLRRYFDKAAERTMRSIQEHREEQPKQSKGTLAKLSFKQISCLKHHHSREEIDSMSEWQARKLCGEYAAAYHAQRAQTGTQAQQGVSA